MQLPLPTFEAYLWPTCAVCHQRVALVGQYTPRQRWGVCRKCSLANPLPIDAFIVGMRDAPSELRIQVVEGESFVRNRYEKLRTARPPAPRVPYTSPFETRQLAMPVCPRCGLPHARLFTSLAGVVDYETYCLRCDDELSVETLWRMRRIWGELDVEDLLDKLFKRSPELFERGVLPDYWFELMRKEASCSP